MHQIQIETIDTTLFQELQDALDNNDIDIIHGRNFSGDLTNIEVYIPHIISVISIVVPVIVTLIKKNRVSSVKIDGKKIELKNVSNKIAEDALNKYFENLRDEDDINISDNSSIIVDDE